MSTYAQQYTGPTSLAPAGAFDCAQRVIVGLGYTIQDANRESGFLRAETAQPVGMRMNGQPLMGTISVTVLPGPPASLAITALERTHADTILARCSSTSKTDP